MASARAAMLVGRWGSSGAGELWALTRLPGIDEEPVDDVVAVVKRLREEGDDEDRDGEKHRARDHDLPNPDWRVPVDVFLELVNRDESTARHPATCGQPD